MMTSVTLPSSSGPLHGGAYSSVAGENNEPEFESQSSSVSAAAAASLASVRPAKRCLSTQQLSDSCKKRRKQSTPVRISSEPEGKPGPEPELQCCLCQLHFVTSEQLQNHLLAEHPTECKKEPPSEDTPLELIQQNRPETNWMNEMSKEWIGPNPNLLTFNPFPQFAPFSESMPRQPIRIFNPEAFCDLCNKEFCNKYFLKTHKANKHGIYSDPPSNEPPGPSASYSATIKLPTSVPSVDLSSIKTDKISPFYPGPFTNKPFQKTSESNEVPTNGFSSNSESDKVSQDDQPEESSSPRATSQTESTSFKEFDGGIYYIPQSKMSPGNDLELANRLRRIGVMNPKAFCEICCKEYCNKYFLRTHKMKRHGIYIPDEKDRDKNESGNFNWQNNMQTSPLNLIMTEQSTDRKTTSPPDISCDICGIKFQNASLSQLHNVSVHSKVDESNKKDPTANADKSGMNAEAISEDLQKLQTMILQLNELDVSKANTTCNACNKEFENRYFLHAHMMTEHGILLDDIHESDKAPEPENTTNNNTLCDLCGKDVQNAEEMKKHMSEAHSNNQGTIEIKEEFNGFTTPEKRVPVVNAERRINMNVTPTSSYCDICNKELCNKYFMKTHMQRMHGIEIENGAQIGGVICDICNKELCSKYFLRVHKHNTHGIVEYGTSLLQPKKTDEITASIEPDPALKPADLAELSHRYFTHFTEVCSICSRRFRSTKWLKAHLLSDHGPAGADKWAELEQQLQQTIGQHSKSGTIKMERTSPTLKIPNGGQERKEGGLQNVLSSLFGVDESTSKTYQCSFCPFTTPLLPLLFVHERSHSLTSDGNSTTPLKCPVCSQSFLQVELLQHHMFSQHPFLPLTPFFNGNNETEAGAELLVDDEDGSKGKKKPTKPKRTEISSEIGQSLKEVAKKAQIPAAYALPQSNEDAGYVMQAFLVEETAPDRRVVVPSVVFLPVIQKQPTPVTLTFTLTPA